MLRLLIDEERQHDATIPVRWIVDKETLKDLEELNAKNPYIFISVTNVGAYMREVNRVLVPLEKGMTFLQFHDPGEHIISAVIVWPWPYAENAEEQYRLMRKKLLDRPTKHSWCHAVNDANGKFDPEFLFTSEVEILRNEVAQIRVVVDQAFFAPEPPTWLKKWVNFLYRYPPKDQCDFRKRMIFAFTLQPFLVSFLFAFYCFGTLLIIVGRLIVILYLLYRGKRFNWKPLIHPNALRTTDIFFKEDWELFFKRERFDFFLTDAEGKSRNPYFRLLRPRNIIFFSILFGAIGFLLYIVFDFLARRISSIPSDGFSGGFFVSAATLTALIVLAHVWSVMRNKPERIEKRQKKREMMREERIKRRREKEEKEAELIIEKQQAWRKKYSPDGPLAGVVVASSSEPPKLPVSVKALPKSMQTFRLRLAEIKSEVCRPYARR